MCLLRRAKLSEVGMVEVFLLNDTSCCWDTISVNRVTSVAVAASWLDDLRRWRQQNILRKAHTVNTVFNICRDQLTTTRTHNNNSLNESKVISCAGSLLENKHGHEVKQPPSWTPINSEFINNSKRWTRLNVCHDGTSRHSVMWPERKQQILAISSLEREQPTFSCLPNNQHSMKDS